MARFGIPLRITTDQGGQFKAELFKRLMQLTGSTHLRTTAYHPSANDLVERFHRQIKRLSYAIKRKILVEILPVVLMGIRAAWKEDLQATTAEMIYESQSDYQDNSYRKTLQKFSKKIMEKF